MFVCPQDFLSNRQKVLGKLKKYYNLYIVSRVIIQGCLKGVSRECEGYLKAVVSVCQCIFKSFSGILAQAVGVAVGRRQAVDC